MRPRPSILVLVLLLAGGAAAGAQANPPGERVRPVNPPPLRLVCWTGPAVSDFCPLRQETQAGAPCMCGDRSGEAALR